MLKIMKKKKDQNAFRKVYVIRDISHLMNFIVFFIGSFILSFRDFNRYIANFIIYLEIILIFVTNSWNFDKCLLDFGICIRNNKNYFIIICYNNTILSGRDYI